jgi:hypothetical protein
MISRACGKVRRLYLVEVCLVLAVLLPSVTPAAGMPCSGVVRDTSGQFLEQVEIFLFEEQAGGPPVAVRITDREGGFDLGGILPGPYRLAAVKTGYRLYIGQVNTLFERSVRVILQPIPGEGEAGSEIIPGNASWSLRLPRRSLLRETGAVELLPRSGAVGAGTDPSVAGGLLLAGEFAQSFEARVFPGDDEKLVDAYGLNTSLRTTGAITERARFSLEGRRRSMDRTGSSDFGSSERAEVSAGLQLDAGVDDRIDVQAFFGSRESAVADSGPAVLLWGYNARWDRQLDGTSRMAVRMDYRDRSAADGTSALSDPVVGQRVVLGGEYETKAARDHRVTADITANLSRGPFSMPGLDGWDVRIRSGDAWSVTAPFTLIYGLEYRHREGYQASAILRPRIGAAWTGNAFALRVVTDYHQSWTPGGPLGYRAELEIPLPEGFLLTGEVARDPMAASLQEAGSGLDGLLVRSYGDLAYEGRSATLVRDGAASRVALTWSDGDLTGLLGTAPDLEAPLLLWAEGTVRFENLELALWFPATGTELTLGMVETTSTPGEEEPVQVRQSNLYSIQLHQDLYRPERGAAWRLAVALIAEDRTATPGESEAELERISRYSMLNAGVSVVF